MLPLALLVTALLDTPKPALSSSLRGICPAAPGVAMTLPLPRSCPALEVSGRADAAGIALDPAFDVDVAPGQFASAGRGDAVLEGYGADGRQIFAQPFTAGGPFHLYVPLSRSREQSLQRLRIVAEGTSAELAATQHGDPEAETLSVDNAHVLIAWDARAFPGLRVAPATGSAPVLVTRGSSTYEQRTFETTARSIVIDFSDGVRSTTRIMRVFGR